MSKQALDLQRMSSCWLYVTNAVCTFRLWKTWLSIGQQAASSLVSSDAYEVTDNFHVYLQSETNEASY